jgi:hypothetical protein
MWKMLIATKGKIVGLALLVLLPVFIVAGAGMLVEALQSGQKHQAAMGLVGLVFFGACSLAFMPSKKYVPGKTFQTYRNKKLSTQKAVKYGYGIVVFIAALLVILAPEKAVRVIGFGLLGISSIYVFSKSLKFHADIDFSTNEYLVSALGFSAGEKVLASYQNFYADDVKEGSNAFAVTATKLIVASFDGLAWRKLTRDFDQISHIGIIGGEEEKYFVKLKFGDGADVLLRIELFEKLTSNPLLVIRRLLETIDASLLGGIAALQAAPRRRVAVNSDIPVPTSEAFSPGADPASMAPKRNIELSPEVLIAIQNAEEVVSGRQLEI